MTLRPYQLEAIRAIEAAFDSGKRGVVYCLPTGGGKTVIFSEVVRRVLARGQRCVVLTHRIELARQTVVRFRAAGLDAGIFNAETKRFPSTPATVAMWQTVHARSKKGAFDGFGQFDLVVFDEAHRAAAENATGAIRAFNPKRLLGVTATPQRPDGKGLNSLFDELILGPSVKDLMADGYLCPYRCFAPAELVDRAALRVSGGDFVSSEASARAVKNMAKLIDNALKYFPAEKTAVVFCADVEHAECSASAFRRKGVPAAVVHGQTPEPEREKALRLLAEKKVKFVVSCDVLTEGVDVPNVDGVVMARPTKSVVVYLQQVGRCLRPAPQKTAATILDLVGNVYEFGLPSEDRQWSLEPVLKNKKDSAQNRKVKRCPECFSLVPVSARFCKECGEEFETRTKNICEKEMTIKEITGVGVNVEAEKAKRALNLPYKDAVAFLDTYASLLLYAKLKGYKKGWAWYQAKDKGLIVPNGI